MPGLFHEKKSRSKNPLNKKAPFKWVFMGIFPATAPKRLTGNTHFFYYLLTFDAYSKIPRLYCTEILPQKKVWISWI